jgi:hypothetical protein
MTEVLSLLKHPILKDLEIVFAEPGDKRIVAIQDGCAEDYHVGIQFERVAAARAALWRLGFLCPGNKWRKDQDTKSNQRPVFHRVVL